MPIKKAIPENSEQEQQQDTRAQTVISAIVQLKAALDDLRPGEENLLFGQSLRTGINTVYNSKSAFFPELYGLPPRPTHEQDIIRSDELNLQKQRDLLESFKRQQREQRAKTYTQSDFVGRGGPSDEDIQRQEKVVRAAERQLALHKGQHAEFESDRKAEAEAKRAAEKAEAEASLAGWQKGWQEYAANLKSK